MIRLRSVLVVAVLSVSGPARGDDGPSPAPPHRVEALEMVAAILRGSGMGPGDGWFHPGEARYGWGWLAARSDADRDGVVHPGEFAGPAGDFARLDRDHDRVLKTDDFDWSDGSTWARQNQYFLYHFRRIDADGDGVLSRGEWDATFARVADGRDGLTPWDFRDFLTIAPPPAPPPPPILLRVPAPSPANTGIPSKRTLLLGLARQEVGAWSEGPSVGDVAPGFRLPTRDGSRTLSPVDAKGRRPVVLVFGSISCGPFRRQMALVEEVRRRHADRADFVMVYVREAHPVGGWRMADNDAVGVSVDQPATLAERSALADRCGATVKIRMPILVDGIDDRVGKAYSGMPGRLYVIDRAGRVAYKGGRGPFGFQPGEMEQALLLTLMADGDADADAGREGR